MLWLLLPLWAAVVLSAAAFAEEPVSQPAGTPPFRTAEEQTAALEAELDRNWQARVESEDYTFTALVVDCGQVVRTLRQQGSLELTCRFARTDWSGYRFNSTRSGCGDPFGENAELRLRCFVYREEGRLTILRSCQIRSSTGELLSCNVSRRELPEGVRSLALYFESFPADSGDALWQEPDSSDSPLPEADALAWNSPILKTKGWTYYSSDGRPLWQVELTGEFIAGRCVAASGRAAALDEAWRCDRAAFYPAGADAVAAVQMTRVALGISVAEESLEFRISWSSD